MYLEPIAAALNNRSPAPEGTVSEAVKFDPATHTVTINKVSVSVCVCVMCVVCCVLCERLYSVSITLISSYNRSIYLLSPTLFFLMSYLIFNLLHSLFFTDLFFTSLLHPSFLFPFLNSSCSLSLKIFFFSFSGFSIWREFGETIRHSGLNTTHNNTHTTLHYTTLHYTALHCTALHWQKSHTASTT